MFTQGLVMDLIHHTGDMQWEVVLVDTHEETLDIVRSVVEKMIAQKGAGRIVVSCTTNRRDALPDADYVVTTIGVGSRRAWEQDVLIPRKYGVFQPVGDTVMPGGISRAMRMIPEMVEVARDVMRLAPRAEFFNYSNPMAMICRAVRKSTNAPMVGLCHGVPNSMRQLTDMLGVSEDGITAYAVGLNHLTYLYGLYQNGQSLFPLLQEQIQQERQNLQEYQIGRMGFLYGEPDKDPFAWSVFEETGAYPFPGDRHITEFYAERFLDGYYGKTQGIDAFSFETIIERGDWGFEKMRQLARSPEPLPDDFFERFSGEHEQLTGIMMDILRDSRSIYSVNLPNGSAYRNLPEYAVLELPAMACKVGLIALPFNNFPENLVPNLKKHIDIVEATVDGALTGDLRLIEEAVHMGGYMQDKQTIATMVKALIEAHQEHLPQF